MAPVFPADKTLPVVLAMIAAVAFALFVVQPAWGRSRPVRWTALGAVAAVLGGVALWGIGRIVGDPSIVHAGVGVTYTAVIVLGPVALSMPLAAGVDRLFVRDVAEPRDEAPPDDVRVGRRALLRFGTGSVPAALAIPGATGLVTASAPPRIPVVPMRWPNLHRDLHGLRILHVSDVHLGACFGLRDLERALAVARAAHRPDLVLLTGDLADDPSLIPEALRLVADVGARYGALASLGNHEYLHGIGVTRPKYEASPVPLLVGRGRTLQIGRATLFVGGADDPVHMGGDIAWMVEPSIVAAIADAPAHADFRLLLCHRPEGHGPATNAGYDLTLAGHTHGGQLGLFGRSLLEKVRPEVSWWGTYAKRRPAALAARAPGGPSRLYTTSGFGHWFPFRLGCPTEMPLIVLMSGGAVDEWTDTPRDAT